VAHAFSDFFITIAEKLHIQQIGERNSTSFLKDSSCGNFSSMRIIPVTEADIKRLMPSPKLNKLSV
jgi:hypothetical protein